MFIQVDKITNEITRVETDRFFYDESKYNIYEVPFYNYINGKLYFINGEIIKE